MVELPFFSKEEESSSLLVPYRDEKETKKTVATTTKKKGPTLALYLVTSSLVIAHLAASLNYLAFKFSLYTREFRQVVEAPWLLLLLACECVYFLSSIISSFDNLIVANDRPEPPTLEDFPTVDILLPCCKEPTEVPQESIMAALAMHYPQDRFRVLVLDDGPDDDLKSFCEALQVESGGQVVYLRRPKIQGIPHNFKCGNLNYGLKHSEAKYVVMMDADMILHPSFLRKLLPYFTDSPNVAFVQVPQSFYNLPIGDPLNDSCVFGYDRVLVHRDSLGCATCIGTGAIFRRKHLNDIGGFQAQSITEDTTTAYTLFNHGYRSVYVNEKLQIGLTPWTLEGYIKQRERWGQGAIQQFCSTWRTMLGRKSKLNFLLKVNYVWHTGFYYLSIANIVLITTLLSALAFHLNMSVGDRDENRKLITYLAMALLLWRLSWYALWSGLPQSVQSRNRDESHFWWMTPFFFRMVIETFFSYGKTFKFVPTSNIDRVAAQATSGKSNMARIAKYFDNLSRVRVHLSYVIVVLVVVSSRVIHYVQSEGARDCQEEFYVAGMSLFLLTTCIHMLIPVIYLLWPTKFTPAQRKKLIRYDAKGVPKFNEEDCIPKWHWSVIIYEMVSYVALVFWSGVLWVAIFSTKRAWCQQESFF